MAKKKTKKKIRPYKLVIKTLQAGFPDYEEVLFHSLFEVLVMYVDEFAQGITAQYTFYNMSDSDIKKEFSTELKHGHLTWEDIEKGRTDYKDIMEIYNWWKEYQSEDFDDKVFASMKYPKRSYSKINKNGTRRERKQLRKAGLKHTQWDKRFNEKRKEMAHRLIELSNYLFT